MKRAPTRALLALLAALLGCSTAADDPASPSGDDLQAYRKRHHPDAAVAAPDAAVAAPDAAGEGGGDGTPVRLPCTSALGSALGGSYGRLDGRLVALVPPRTSGCPSDS